MAIYLPIVTQFNDKGVKDAQKGFDELQTKSAKAGAAFKKAFFPAVAVVGALGTALFDATKAALEDEAQQALLASQLRKTTGATDKQIEATEDYISKQLSLKGFTDSELRPAFEKLSRATGDLDEAQRLTNTAMDIAVATGKPLETVVGSLEKAFGGNMGAIQRLLPEYRDMIKEGATFEEVMAKIDGTLGGAASEAALTAEARFKIFKEQIGETKEAIGSALLPAIEAVLPYMQKLADFAEKNPDAFLIIAAALGAIALSIMAINIAMALNPVGLIIIGVIALIAILALAYKKFEGFRKVIDFVINSAIAYFESLANAFIKTVNVIIRAINLVKPGKDIEQLGELNLGRIGDPKRGDGFSALNIPAMADGGIIRASPGGTLALIGEGGRDEAVIPLDRAGNMGGNNVTIHVNGGDPNAVVDALRRYMQLNGSVPIRVS